MTTENSARVNRIRICVVETNKWDNYNEDVFVQPLQDSQTQLWWLRLEARQQEIFLKPLNSCQWVEDSSADGVASIVSQNFKILILYDSANKRLCNFFEYLRSLIEQAKNIPATHATSSAAVPRENDSSKITTSSPRQRRANKIVDTEQIGVSINKFVQSIQEGSTNDAENLAQELSRYTVSARFNLINSENNQKQKKSTAATPASDARLKLTLQIESHLNRPTISAPIYVSPGTSLAVLKQQIENETGVSATEQFWYANGRHLLKDDYVFGSQQSVSPPPPKLLPRNQQQMPLSEPVRTGDTLILYIAKSAPLC